MGKLVAVFLFSTLLAVAIGGKQDKQAEQSSPAKSSTPESISKLFGITGTYANVHRKNHPQGRSTKLYNLSLEIFDGKSYLVGTSSAENHSATYMYRMDDVQLITFPNPDYEKPDPPKQFTATSPSSSLRQKVIQLKKDIDGMRHQRADLRRAVASKKRKLVSFKSTTDDLDEGVTQARAQEQALLEGEIDVYQAAITKLETKIEKQNLALVKSRSEAVSQGIFDRKFE